MNEFDLLSHPDRVGAPPDFERMVLAELAVRKNRRIRLRKTYRLAFAGAAVVLAAFILLSVPVLKRTETVVLADKESVEGFSRRDLIPVMETLDYSSEVQNVSYGPQTLYILEQVSEASSSEMTY